MKIRRKQGRRLLAIAIVVVMLTAVAVGAYVWRQHQRDAEAVVEGELGRAAAAVGDDRGTLSHLGRYLRRFGGQPGTAKDYVLYAKARRQIPEPNGAHLRNAIGALRKALDLDPDLAVARDELLDLYTIMGYTAEALDLLEVSLRVRPDDVKLRADQCRLLASRRRFAEALAAADELNVVAPDYLEGYILALQLRLRMEQPMRTIEDWADSVADSRDEDPRFELVRSLALSRLAERDPLDEALATRGASSLERVLLFADQLTDAFAIRVLVSVLDAGERFDESLDVLVGVADGAEIEFRTELVRRLWFVRRRSEISPIIERWIDEGKELEAEVLAIDVLARHGSSDDSDVARAMERLSSVSDRAHEAWAAALGVREMRLVGETSDAAGAEDAQTAMQRLNAALAQSPGSALLHQALGDLHFRRLGEADLARDSWAKAAAAAPSWGLPLRHTAESLIRTDRQHLAPALAEAALRRDPSDPRSYEVFFRSLAANSTKFPQERSAAILASVQELRDRVPSASSTDFLAVELDLLARTDPAAVRERLLAVLHSPPVTSETSLMRLAEIARRVDPELGERFIELSEKLHGITARLAYARAIMRAEDLGADAALRLLDSLRARAPDSDDIDWDMVHAALLDSLGRAAAGPEWIRIADANEGSNRAQLGALSSASAWRDRDAIDRIIARVAKLTGPTGVTWRLMRARWVLADPDATESDIADATTLLTSVTQEVPQSVEAHVLLSRAQERLGKLEGAETQLRAAAELSPDNIGIGLELARLAERQGRRQSAAAKLDDVLRGGQLSPSQLTRAAYLLAAQGDLRRSADVLSASASKSAAPRAGLLLLADLYARLGETERALAICEQLLASPDVATLELAARLYSSVGRDTDADVILSRLEAVGTPPAEAALIRARHAERWGDLETAAAQLWAAVDAEPTGARAWEAILSHAIARGDTELFGRVLDDDRGRDNAVVMVARDHRDLFEPAMLDPRLRALVEHALVAPPDREAALNAVRSVVSAKSALASQVSSARTVDRLAEENTHILALQLLAADLSFRVGRKGRACDVAARSAFRFPNSAAASQQNAELLAASARWREAVEAGLAWRERVVGSRSDVDAFVVRAMLHDQRTRDAVVMTDEWDERIGEDPDEHATSAALRGLALLCAGRRADAEALVSDLGARSRPVRFAMLAVDTSLLRDPAIADAWLTMVASVVPAEDSEAAITLARAWAAAFEVTGEARFRDRSQAVLRRLGTSGERNPDALFIEGVVAARSGDLAKAEQAYTAALEAAPTFVVARNNLAMVLADAGQHEQALAHAESLVDARPDVAEFLDTLGYVHWKAGRLRDARIKFQKALDRDPSNVAFLVNLADVLHDLGDVRALSTVLARFADLVEQGTAVSDSERERIEILRSRPR